MNPLRKIFDIATSQWVRVSGESMLPSLRHGQWVRFSRIALGTAGPRRFDIVRFEPPVDGLRFDVKRVVGLPGEDVELRAGVIHVGGEAIKSPIVGGGDARWTPGEDEYVVLGDNRSHSTDSRRYGVINRRAIRGRVVR